MASQTSRPCSGCAQPFEPARSFHRLCWACWGEQDRADSPRTRRPAPRVTSILDARVIRAALALTHPDRHPPERAEQATRTTQELTIALARAREIEKAAA